MARLTWWTEDGSATGSGELFRILFIQCDNPPARFFTTIGRYWDQTQLLEHIERFVEPQVLEWAAAQ